jgi:hypothetical protein
VRHLLWAQGLILASVLVPVACGGIPSGASANATQPPSPGASSVPSQSPASPLPSAASGYKAYVSSTSRYSVEYPGTWFESREQQDGSHSGKDFMSQNIGSPMQIDATGIWLTIVVNTAPGVCSLGSNADPTKMTSLAVSIDGVSSTAWVVLTVDPNFQGGDGLVGVAGPDILHGGWCYSFGFLTSSVDDTHLHMAEIQHIYASFRFNR